MINHYKTHRHHYIMSEIQKYGRVSISALAKSLKVTERTVRRDINELANAKRITPCYGGAILVKNPEHGIYGNSQKFLYKNMKELIQK